MRTFDVQPIMSKPIARRGMLDMNALMRANGTKFDRLWLDVISGHHAGAIQMAQIEFPGGRSSAAKDLAKSIIRSQSDELTQFNELADQMKP